MIRHLLFKFSRRYRVWRIGSTLALALVLCAPAWAVSAAQGSCEQGGKVIVAPASVGGSPQTRGFVQSYKSCTVTVYLAGTITKATIYSDSSSTPLANPFTADTTGWWRFFSANGTYDVQIAGGGPPALAAPYTFGSISILDPTATGISIATTTPITASPNPILTTGTIACPTCIVASSPAVGIGHFAGSTQTITSSAVVLSGADVTGNLGVSHLNSGTSAGGTTFWRGDGTWAVPAGAGTVTSVGFTGGIVSVATATTTPAFTIAGTSGGIPYFSSASTWASSALLTNHGVLIGGGAAGAPKSTTAGTSAQVLTSNGSSSDPTFQAIPICSTCVTAAAALTSTALMTGAGSTASQTPCATCTLDASGNLILAASINTPLYQSATNCADSAGAAACGAAPAGAFVTDTGSTSTVVSTTAVTANSEIFIQFDSSLGTRLSVTCNTDPATVAFYRVSARTAGVSFTVSLTGSVATNPVCWAFHIIN